MSDPNSALSVWQLTLLAVVPFALLVGWLIACFIAAREPRSHGAAAAGPATGTGTGTGASTQDFSSQDIRSQDEAPARPDRRLAA
jgi:hypothetical protein